MARVLRFQRSQRSNSDRQSWRVNPWLLVGVIIVGAVAGYALAKLKSPSLLSGDGAHLPTVVGQASVIDGDTIEIHGERIRFHGIDAPERGQSCLANGEQYGCGQQAAFALADRIGTRTVTCEPRDRDRYERLVAVCRAGEEDLNAWMVAEGWALAYRRYSTDYVMHEDAASAAKRGIWGGQFVAPWDWRRGERLVTAKVEGDQSCDIKGNISRYGGERIYHLPGGQYYDRTIVNTAKGERWFCAEADARAAGWRRSKR